MILPLEHGDVLAGDYLKSCDVCAAAGPRLFHHDGCEVAGGRYAVLDDEAGDGTRKHSGEPACRSYPLGFPRCHPADPTACAACMAGIAHVGIFGDRERDRNRVLFLEVRALIPGACFVVCRTREDSDAVKVRDQLEVVLGAARHDVRREAPAAARARLSLWARVRAWFGR